MRERARYGLIAAGLAALCVLGWALWPAGDGPAGSLDASDRSLASERAALRTVGPTLETAVPAPPVPDLGEIEDEEPAPEETKRFALQVRDLFDGRAVPGMTVRLLNAARQGVESGSLTARQERDLLVDALRRRGPDPVGWGDVLRADDAGRLQVSLPARAAGRAFLVEETRPPYVLDGLLSEVEDTLWVYRTFQLHLRVVADGAPFGNDWVRPAFVFFDSKDWIARRPAGLPDRWVQEVQPDSDTDLGPFELVSRTARTRSFEADLPRGKGLLVRAESPGLLDAWARVDVEADTEDAHVELRMRKAPRIQGKVVDEVGAPVKDAALEYRVTVAAGDEDRITDHMWGVRGGCTVAGGEADPHLRFESGVFIHRVKGTFAFHLPIEGRARLRASCEGHEPAILELGDVSDDRSGITIVLQRIRGKPVTHVQLLLSGKPLPGPGMPITIQKLEGTAITQVFALQVGPEGRVPTKDLERGARYLVLHGHELPKNDDDYAQSFLGEFTWDGQERVELGP